MRISILLFVVLELFIIGLAEEPDYPSRDNMSKKYGAAFQTFQFKCAVKDNLPILV
jgi:hypothetical protein